MISYDPGAWHDLFMMTGGASAALAGLIFVAVSVNHEVVLASKTLPLVAARTLVTLLGLVILCVLVLTPAQPARRLGIEVLVLGLLLLAGAAGATIRSTSGLVLAYRLDDYAAAAAATLPLVAGGVSLIAGGGGGMYWLMIEVITALAATTYYAWALLIEIRR